ncbi:glucose-6-phosphate isomerase [Amphritea pacifica]|uniref:Glucose-6-phosphate isomerase n=1 Tax=Amphritea pacifica TaxID=2811233 RepID=A0ABS2W6Z9_9GAMM|nr:glucose-6-phosphate isomerase [Amphritea pacifica]MBN0987484.1 glucose-6-phosphate isomerase [Amphritea pacifica]MBN1005193.1 glucose-6-phosphate isomerase [Amphritea pacifica]
MYQLSSSVTWKKLVKLAEKNSNDKISDYFKNDPERFNKMSLQLGEIFLDYSKNKISDETLKTLITLADHSPLHQRRAQMFSGDIINVTEKRPVLHTALRNRGEEPVVVNGEDVMPAIRASLKKLETFSNKVRSGEWKGFSGKRIRSIVNIGIGGSDLGPNMVCRALLNYKHPELSFHFISNVDGQHIKKVLTSLDPETTLFIVSTKTFSTQETLLNASTARRWFIDNTGQSDIGQHFVALSTNQAAAMEFGIRRENIFEFWAWVGGRYSLWSSIGLAIALSIGYDRFIELLEGAYEMDRHFVEAPLISNMPVLMALIGIWNINFLGAETQAIIPYDQALHQLPAFLQQLDMESNGKSVDMEGHPVDFATGPIVWGQTGSNGQHAFFQLLHQGTRFVPIDFIASLEPDEKTEEHHFALLTNMLAQANAFMNGDQQEGILDYQTCPGNRPSNTLLLDRLTPHNLGALIALYEHKVFVQGAIWNINSFDQWGVQLGKRLATEISRNIELKSSEYDPSTQGLMNIVRSKMGTKQPAKPAPKRSKQGS